MSNQITIERWKKSKYIVNVPTESGILKPITWSVPVGKRPSSQKVTMEIYEWIVANTKAFDVGELRLADAQIGLEKEELLEMINDQENYEINAKTNDEILNMLTKSKLPQLTKELNLITEKSTKKQVKDVFETVKEDLVGSKIKIVEDWLKENKLMEE